MVRNPVYAESQISPYVLAGVIQNSIYYIGPEEEKSSGLNIEYRKRRRSGPTSNNAMDTNDSSKIIKETLVTGDSRAELCLKFGFADYFAVDRVGRGGGLTVFWRNNFSCKIVNSSSNHIDVHVMERNLHVWRLTCFYGFPERARRQESCDFLRNLAGQDQIPWCIFGDFNNMLYVTDKKGIHPHPQALFDGFRSTIEDCSLSELALTGGEFTWEKSKGTPNYVRERLDRAFATDTWWHKFPMCNLCRKVRKQKEVLNELVNGEDEDGVRKYFEERDQFNDLLLHEEQYWKQRAKAFWLTEGDTNSKLFHAQASSRKKLNHIAHLKNDAGDLIDNHDAMCEMMKEYYKGL
ncbi:uncharacterized protein LOC141679915 [Apium graveolens]|uniref:uncharacterized protein LOC141679915 n=1 Tax=Apium graveolens TaxID=4045 RepID=UPI003D7BF260